ncbi:hypothetical protein DPEC_G00204520 [Dallia pectoralis]|uniref:Uncharacterized protein n=1 Tax=Dallia pectoralis TaxID=75939 RepID=A0ACC2G9T6_DALPE|nr:hypothetical protein DPEC_G00204520 [Dallia pectoralis]
MPGSAAGTGPAEGRKDNLRSGTVHRPSPDPRLIVVLACEPPLRDLLDDADDPPLLAELGGGASAGGPFRMFSVVKRGRVNNLLWETEGTNKAQTRLATEHSAKTWYVFSTVLHPWGQLTVSAMCRLYMNSPVGRQP